MRLKLIYNPYSGNKSFMRNLDPCIKSFQAAGYDVHIFRSSTYGDISEHMSKMSVAEYQALVVSGGDGTINIVLNAMQSFGLTMPLGIIPSGTANDFATYLKIPSEPHNAAKIIAAGHTGLYDIGMVNDKYFINVCAAGLLANVSQTVDERLKDSLGKFAYYIRGLEQLPNFMPLPMKITNRRNSIESDLYFFIVLNSTGTGGFEQLSPGALATDGLFDFIGFKAVSLVDLAMLFVKVLKGEFLDDANIIFFRDEYVKVEYTGANIDTDLLRVDIDGEPGPLMPIEIKNIHNGVKIFVPTQ